MLKIAIVLSLLACSAPALAKPHNQEPPQDDPFASFFSLNNAAVEPVKHERARVSPRWHAAPVLEPYSGGSNLLAVARRYIGSGNFTGSHRSWCSDSINAWLRASGHRTSGSGLAISHLHDGPHVSNPQPGDLAVSRGHVTIFAGFGGRGFYGLGGNQHHRVQVSNFSLHRIIAWVRPR